MNRNDVDWEGPITAMITPFHRDGELDERGLRTHVDFLVAQRRARTGAQRLLGRVLGADAGRAQARGRRSCSTRRKSRVPVIPGVGGNTTREVIELAQHARDIGCDGVMVMAPSMVHPKKEDLFQHFKAVSDRVADPDHAVQQPAGHRQRPAFRSGRASRRPRAHRRDQGQHVRLQRVLEDAVRAVRDDPRVHRPVDDVRRARGA